MIHSLAWALDQPIPGTAKLVLIGCSKDANDGTGLVNFDPEEVARVAHIAVPSLWRYLGALERNQYLDKDETLDGRRYYLVLDRETDVPWSWSVDDVQLPAEDEPAPTSRKIEKAAPRFSRAKQSEVREASTAPRDDRPPDMVGVIEGTEAFHKWVKHDRSLGRVPPFVMAIKTVSGKDARGFYKPTLFPPQDRLENLEGAA